MIYLSNCSKKDVVIEINKIDVLEIPVGDQIEYSHDAGGVLTVTLRHSNESYKKRNVANIMVETTYIFPVPQDNAVVSISREVVRFNIDACYDCFFLKCDGITIDTFAYRATGIDALNRRFVQARIIDMLVVEPVTSIGLHDAMMYIVAIAAAAYFGWGYLWMFLLAVYSFNLFIGLVSEGLAKAVMKAFCGQSYKSENMHTKLEQWSNPDFIAKCIANENRNL